jgi:hypothetical protein
MKLLIGLIVPILVTAQSSAITNPNLQAILELTDSQWTRIQSLNRLWYSYRGEKLTRLEQVNKELAAERLRPEIDPTALGLRYFEIAAICQESTARLSMHRQDLGNVLTQQQQAKLIQLENGVKLLPSIQEAEAILLLTTPGWRITKSSIESGPPGCPSDPKSGAYYLLVTGSPLKVYPNLTRYLDLSEHQLRQILLANQRLAGDLEESKIEVEAIEQAIQRESALPTPRISLLGDKAARLEQICRESIALKSGIEKALPGMLSSLQLERWQALEMARKLLPVISESQTLNLSSFASSDALPPLIFSSFATREIEWSIVANDGPNLPGCGATKFSSPPFAIPLFDPFYR